VKFSKVLSKGLESHYEYDFGSTTDLDIKVVWEREGKWGKKGLLVLARNEATIFKCVTCRKTAKVVCAECGSEEEAAYCDRCATKHKCGEEKLLPIANSPRMGICGYTGNESEEDGAFLRDDLSSDAVPVSISVGADVGRNDSCPCGSGKKYKKCCLS
jgi:hypothetical protein